MADKKKTRSRNQAAIKRPTQKKTSPPKKQARPRKAAKPISPAVGSLGTKLPLDVLNDQMQLSYQIIKLQLLLQGALSDEYTPEQGLGKRHVTYGCPAYSATPRPERWSPVLPMLAPISRGLTGRSIS